MDLSLTEAEQQAAEAMIHRLESSARAWPWVRWVLLLIAALAFGTGAFDLVLERSILLATASSDALNSEWITMLVCAAHVGGLFCVFVAVYLAASVTANWRKHRRAAVMAKILRAQVKALGTTG